MLHTISMGSSAEFNGDLQAQGVRERTDLYMQLREQLLDEVERYRKEGKKGLAEIISRSLDE